AVIDERDVSGVLRHLACVLGLRRRLRFCLRGDHSSLFFFKQKTAYEIGLGIPAEPLFRSLNRSRKARVSYKVQRTINASLNAATSTRAVSSNPNFVTRQKIEIIFG